MTNHPSPAKYRPDIDGLRAVAVTLVIFYHANLSVFTGGFVGVDVFFVISGFLITQLLREELASTGTIRLRNFYARRVRRLLPALLVVLISTLVVWVFFFTGLGDPVKIMRSTHWSLLGMANIYFMRNTNGYFDGPSGEMPFLHLWSLSVEEQFYLFWPFLLLVMNRPWLKLNRFLKTPFILIAVITVISFVRSQYLVINGPQSWAFYEMPSRAWELGLGALTLFAFNRSSAVPIRLRPQLTTLAALIGLLAVLLTALFYNGTTPFPGLGALPAVLGTSLIIWAGGVSPSNFLSRVLSWKPIVKIGKLSYGWYLWHWPFFALSRVWNLGEESPTRIRVLIIFLSLGMAELSFRFIESPIRHGKVWKQKGPFATIGAGAAACFLLGLLAAALPKLEYKALGLRFGQEIIDGIVEVKPYGANCFDLASFGTDRCDFSFSPKEKTARHRIAIWGDSHACSYFPMLTDYARAHQLDASLYCIGRTPPLPSHVSDAVLADLKKKRKDEPSENISIALVSRWTDYASDKSGLERLETGLRKNITDLNQAGISRILIILPYPDLRHTILRCLNKEGLNCARTRSENELERAAVVGILKEIAQSFSNVRLIDPLPHLCTGENCPLIVDHVPLFVDDNHPTVKSTQRIGKKIESDLAWFAD
jgi:peptidoglycan/LPS O-acetylase OafA/YrhL